MINVSTEFKMVIVSKILEGLWKNFFKVYKTETHRCLNILGIKIRISSLKYMM